MRRDAFTNLEVVLAQLGHPDNFDWGGGIDNASQSSLVTPIR